MAKSAPAREWVSFPDPDEDRTWLFDVSFLMSRWTCIYGAGCQGVLTEPAPELVHGCCSYGAHFTGKKDLARIEKIAKTLTDDQWQYKSVGEKRGIARTRNEETTTRLVDGACIFLNRPGFPGGPGCALHRTAIERGVEPLTLKPDVCWQLPLRLEETTDDFGHITSTVTEWGRRQWGEGGAEFAWWCTEAPEAFVGADPVYKSLAPEIEKLVGKRVARLVNDYLDNLVPDRQNVAFLPHPTVRTRTGQPAAT